MAFGFIADVDNDIVIGNQDYGSANQSTDLDVLAFNALFKHGGKIVIKIIFAETLLFRSVFLVKVFVHYRLHRRLFLFSAVGNVFFCHWFKFKPPVKVCWPFGHRLEHV